MCRFSKIGKKNAKSLHPTVHIRCVCLSTKRFLPFYYSKRFALDRLTWEFVRPFDSENIPKMTENIYQFKTLYCRYTCISVAQKKDHKVTKGLY